MSAACRFDDLPNELQSCPPQRQLTGVGQNDQGETPTVRPQVKVGSTLHTTPHFRLAEESGVIKVFVVVVLISHYKKSFTYISHK